MGKLKELYKRTSWYPAFNMDTEFGRARTALVLQGVPQAVVSGFTAGTFYTGLLIGYGINIVNISILNTIPYLACLFSIFTPYILERFPKRRVILSVAQIAYFFINIVGITILPELVHDEAGRIVGLVAIVFVSNIIHYLFNGYGPWHVHYIEPGVRNTYQTASTLISSITSSVVMLISSAIMDAVSPQMQLSLIKILRYASFGIALVYVWLLQLPKEPVYLKSAEKPAIIDIFRRPLQEKKFRLLCLVIFLYQFCGYIPTSVLNVWLLEEVKVSYLYINAVNAVFILFIIVTSPIWNRIVRRWGNCVTLVISLLIYMVAVGSYAFVNHSNYLWLMTFVRFTEHALTMGIGFSTGNLYYEQLPPKDRTAHISFYTMAQNFAMFLGSSVGTLFIARMGSSVLKVFGRNLSGVPVLLLIQAVLFLLLAVLVFLLRDRLKPTEENRTTG